MSTAEYLIVVYLVVLVAAIALGIWLDGRGGGPGGTIT